MLLGGAVQRRANASSLLLCAGVTSLTGNDVTKVSVLMHYSNEKCSFG